MTTSTQQHPRRKTLRRLFVLIPLILIVWIVLFGCHVEILQLQKLAQAKSSWDSKHVTHYEEVFIVRGFCGFPCGAQIKMEVVNNQILNATSKASFIPTDDAFKPVTQEQIVSGQLQNYTIDALFRQAENDLQNIGIIAIQSGNGRVYHLDYDPHLGFISRYDVDDCGQGSLLTGGIGDCYWGVTVKLIDLIN